MQMILYCKKASSCVQFCHRYMFYFVDIHNYICEHSETRPYAVLLLISHVYVYTFACEAKQLHLCPLILFGIYMKGFIGKNHSRKQFGQHISEAFKIPVIKRIRNLRQKKPNQVRKSKRCLKI